MLNNSVNSHLKTRPSISALKQPDNSVTHSDQEKSELFNEFFASVFTNVHSILTLMYTSSHQHYHYT